MKIPTILMWILMMVYSMNLLSQVNQLAPTPPMGWNSWDCFGMDVTDEELKATADYMAEHLKEYGWEYVVLDMGWYFGEKTNTWNFKEKNPELNIDEYGRVVPALHKFPSAANEVGLKAVADYIHSLGLKFGIHIVRGIPRQAVEENTPIKGTNYRAKDIASEKGLCGWYHGMYSIDMSKPGAQEYYNSLLEQYAEWGVDFIKADDMLGPLYHLDEIEAVQKARLNTGRPIVLSLSAGPVPVELADVLRRNSNMWRLSGDMWDSWPHLLETFEYCRTWQDYVIPNHWPDCDMLPLGKLRINGTDGLLAEKLGVNIKETVNEYSRLTTDEKYTLMSLWAIFRSPLMMGGNLMENDSLTYQLLTNEEVLRVNQQSVNNKELRFSEKESIWIADDPVSGAKYIALFNLDDNKSIKFNVSTKELGLSGRFFVRDLWEGKDLGAFKKNIRADVNPHGCKLFKISQ
jgi:hypothetical protein